MNINEKAAEVLNTLATAQENVQGDFTAKRFATLRARAAIAGVTLYAIENDHGAPRYIVSRWNLTRELSSLDAVERWLDLTTGRRA